MRGGKEGMILLELHACITPHTCHNYSTFAFLPLCDSGGAGWVHLVRRLWNVLYVKILALGEREVLARGLAVVVVVVVCNTGYSRCFVITILTD